ncbi:MAG: hypothetical protein OXH67_10345 [Acidimicrobiaceae bacterium]|nr:hypothetical protein [Acidimicrobiaceae bacterium]
MGNASFALHELGWSDFQSLCGTVCREVLGQTVVGYLDHNDGGRDGAFVGVWKQCGGETFSGEFVIQAKHTTKPDATLGPADLADELEKAQRLAASGRCDVYVLMTNARITGQTEQKLKTELRSRGVHQSLVIGSTWINATIAENPRLRMLVPRLYGLGDLTQILDERSYQQARAVLDSMRTDLAKLVRTTTYEKSARALDDHGFVLLTGAPATGKTTIAGQLALAAADVFGTHVVMLEDATQFAERWNPNEKQLFWLDDAFGATQFTPSLAHSWQRIIPKVKSAISTGSKFVLTTRDYIRSHASRYLKAGDFPPFDLAEVVVDVTELTPRERRQILYNHLKHGQQPKTFLRRLKPHLEKAADHWGFTPELARRLADPTFTKDLTYPTDASVTDFFENPRQFLADTFASLDTDSLSALGLIFISRGWLPSPIPFNQREELLAGLGSTSTGVIYALQHMDGSLVAHVARDGQSGWTFAHPTMIDAYADQIRNPELLHLLIEGFDTHVLVTRTTCGDTGIANAIILPDSVWPTVIDHLNGALRDTETSWAQRNRCHSYLATQCVPAFQRLYLQRHPDLLDELTEPGLQVDVDSGNSLIASLHRHGMLPEQTRAGFVGHLIDYCIDGTDGAVLWHRRFRKMLTPEEDHTLRTRLLTEVVPNPKSIVQQFTSSFSSDDDPDEFTQPLMEFADALVAEFNGNEAVEAAAMSLEDARLEWIWEQGGFSGWDDDDRRYDAPRATSAPAQGHRSMFDDLVEDL